MDHGPVIRRPEPPGAERRFVRPLLTVSSRGRERLDGRTALDGIVWQFRAGTAWRDMPERYGPRATPRTRFRRWSKGGTFERMPRAAWAGAGPAGDMLHLYGASVHGHAQAPVPRPEGAQPRR
ncbi:transposase [Streptomyces eurythermus]|uniref:transposase n=1 Tax=Streptomyces eurythermus TaxID=42237 RepID=UPI0036D3C20E